MQGFEKHGRECELRGYAVLQRNRKNEVQGRLKVSLYKDCDKDYKRNIGEKRDNTHDSTACTP